MILLDTRICAIGRQVNIGQPINFEEFGRISILQIGIEHRRDGNKP